MGFMFDGSKLENHEVELYMEIASEFNRLEREEINKNNNKNNKKRR